MTKWRLDNHLIGKPYGLTQDNMNAMIADIERLQKELTEADEYNEALSRRTQTLVKEVERLRARIKELEGESGL